MNEKNKFVEAMEKEVAWKKTENGQDALNTTFDACLDLFSTIGALRKRSDSDIEAKIGAAYAEDKLVCMKIIFYARDIEEGLGERRVFRIALKYLAQRHSKDVAVNIANIVKYGRFDDLYELVDTPVEEEAFKYFDILRIYLFIAYCILISSVDFLILCPLFFLINLVKCWSLFLSQSS